MSVQSCGYTQFVQWERRHLIAVGQACDSPMNFCVQGFNTEIVFIILSDLD